MRQLTAVSVSALVLLLLALVAPAMAEFNLPLGKKVQPTTTHLAKSLSNLHLRAHAKLNSMSDAHPTKATAVALTRRFGAKQQASGACTEVQTQVLAVCPGLDKAMGEGGDPSDFINGYCGSTCATQALAIFAANPTCNDEMVQNMKQFAAWCEVPETRKCVSGDFFKASQQMGKTCGEPMGHIMEGLGKNESTEFKTELSGFCSTCAEPMIQTLVTYQECFSNDKKVDVDMFVGLIDLVCTRDTRDNVPCGAKIAMMEKMDCGKNEAGTACKADQGSWCSATTCEPDFTQERLGEFCSDCLIKFFEFAASLAANGEEIGGGMSQAGSGQASHSGHRQQEPSAQAVNEKEDMVAVMRFMHEMMCTSVDDIYCLPYLAKFGEDDSAKDKDFGEKGFNASTLAAICEYPRAQCLVNIVSFGAVINAAMAEAQLDDCGRRATSQEAFNECNRDFAVSVKDAIKSVAVTALLCSSNDKGVFCMETVSNISSTNCFESTTCTDSCRTYVTEMYDATGCCWPILNEYFYFEWNQDVTDFMYPEPYTVSANHGENFTYTPPAHTSTMPDRSMQPANKLIQTGCLENTTAFWTVIETPCGVSADAVQEELGLPLAWDELKNDPALQEKMKDSVTNDLAKELKVLPSEIKNVKLEEDTSREVQTKTGTRHRRQSSTSKAVKVTFAIDSKNKTQTAKAAEEFKKEKAAGTLATPATQSTVKTQCPTCVDTRASTTGSLAAPVTPPPPKGAKVTLPSLFKKSGAVGQMSAVAVAIAAVLALVL